MSKIQTLLTLTFIGLALVISAIQGCGKSSSSSSSSQPTVTLKGGTSEWITPYSYSHYTPYSFTQWVTLQRAISTLISSKVKVFKFAVSTSKACTDPITIFSSVAGVEQDLLTSPTFGSGQVAAGTYPCVLIEVSKIIHTQGTTLCTTEFPDVICNDNQLSQLIDGTSVTCTGGYDNDQHVTLYINTLNTGNRGDRALLPPSSETDTASGLKLTSPFVVSSLEKALIVS